MKKLTNDIIGNRLIGRNIRRLDDYINSTAKMRWRCLDSDKHCNFEWLATSKEIIGKHKTGCMKCSNKIKLTNDIIDKKLTSRCIKRLGNIITNKIKIEWSCLICNNIWITSPNSILAGTGCNKCSIRTSKIKRSLNNEIIDSRLANLNIKRLNDYTNNHTEMSWQHIICGHEWKTTAHSILDGKSGCPKCCWFKNEKIVGDMLSKFNIKYITQQRINKLNYKYKNYRVDYYIPDANTIIEYNGRQHYEPVSFGTNDIEHAKLNFNKQILRDKYIEKFCKDNNINLICIDGRKYKTLNLEKYMENFIIQILNKGIV